MISVLYDNQALSGELPSGNVLHRPGLMAHFVTPLENDFRHPHAWLFQQSTLAIFMFHSNQPLLARIT